MGNAGLVMTGTRIAGEGTIGIEMNAGSTGSITDVIVENVSITNFTHGIKAVSDSANDYEISGVRLRGFRPISNHRQLYINAKYAYNWDVQGFNINYMMEDQGGVEIINAGKPSSYTGENKILKFLQVNCNADRSAPPAFCVQVEKHGGLYFRQLHHEGADKAIKVKDISPSTNAEPIVFESAVATGEFKDASMKLYLIGNSIIAAPEVFQPGLDDARLRFIDAGVNSTLVDCGDVHWDWTDADGDPNDPPAWEDIMMVSSHSERNRASFFAASSGASYIKPHTYCPSGVSGLPNINEVGGELFDNGVLPTEAGLYSNSLTTANVSTVCPSGIIANCLEDLMDYDDATPDNGGSVYIDGCFTVNRTVNIPRGSQIIGAPGAELILGVQDVPLLKIELPVLTSEAPYRASGIVIRNLKLKTTQTGTTTGLAMIGQNSTSVGASSDIHFSGLTIEGFNTGFYAGPYDSTKGQPMIDGMSLKNLSFINNSTAVRVFSGNASNWNVNGLNIESSTANAVGWHQTYGGHQGLQNVNCQGVPLYKMKDCIRLEMSGGFYLTGLKRTTNVTNALTTGENASAYNGIYVAPGPVTMVVRNSDFTSSAANNGRMNLIGKAFITSMNNKYQYFNAEATYKGTESRVTYCGDNYSAVRHIRGSTPGIRTCGSGCPTLTRVECGTRPMPWEDAVRLGGTSVDKPLVGNFYDDVREDFVIYREGTTGVPQSKFLIKQTSGVSSQTIDWGLKDDLPMVSRFFPSSRAQIVIFRPSTGFWWIKDPNNSANNSAWAWGLSGDVPFVGNFFDESGSVSGNHDEAAVYRPSNKTFYIINPRTGVWTYHTTTPDNDSKIQVGDFLGVGYDQIAQFKNGTWNIINPRNNNTYYHQLGNDGRRAGCRKIPVRLLCADRRLAAGRSDVLCRRSLLELRHQKREHDMGIEQRLPGHVIRRRYSAHDKYGGWVLAQADSIPADGRVFPYSIANGQWWIHDPF